MAERIFYTMGEVAEMFDVNTSLIRHWESQFPILRPKRNKKGNRLFTPQDVEHLKMIYHLVKECGMTLDGAKRALRKGRGVQAVERDTQLMEHLQRIRSLLVEVREDLKGDGGELVDDGAEMAAAADAGEMPRVETPRRGRAAAGSRGTALHTPAGRPDAAPTVPADAAPTVPADAAPTVPVDATPAVPVDPAPAVSADAAPADPAEPLADSLPGQPARRSARKPRRKREETENKELFAFYEQSLF